MSVESRSFWRQLLNLAIVITLAFGIYAWFHHSMRSPMEGQPAPAFSMSMMRTGTQEVVHSSALRGSVVVLDFWASWCGACRASVSDLNQVAQEFANNQVHFFGVNVEDLGPRRAQQAIEEYGANFPSGNDRSGAMQRAFGVRMLPTLVVMDRRGIVQRVISGVPGASTLRKAIVKALSDPPAQQ